MGYILTKTQNTVHLGMGTLSSEKNMRESADGEYGR